ncbi:hypothetical protein [Trichormus azollae]|uniref:hypothetical protein n=1 Tax=Trichormus azollae TaxID=1164 RepID=UPI0016519C09|nr:hypothetical protein [Trichormus azollae]
MDRPIQIVEYERYTWICSVCGETQRAHWSPEIVPGQDIGIIPLFQKTQNLNEFLTWPS